MDKKVSEPSIETRQRILQSALSLFHARSYVSVGVQEICDSAGVTKGSFYHFFTSKDDLAIAVIDLVWEFFSSEMKHTFSPDVPPLQRIENLLIGICDKANSMKQKHGRMLGCPFGNLASELGTQSDAIRARLARVFDEQRLMLEQTLKEAIDRGDLDRNTDVKVAAQSILVFIQGMAVLGKAYNDPEMIRPLAQQAMSMLKHKPAPVAA